MADLEDTRFCLFVALVPVGDLHAYDVRSGRLLELKSVHCLAPEDPLWCSTSNTPSMAFQHDVFMVEAEQCSVDFSRRMNHLVPVTQFKIYPIRGQQATIRTPKWDVVQHIVSACFGGSMFTAMCVLPASWFPKDVVGQAGTLFRESWVPASSVPVLLNFEHAEWQSRITAAACTGAKHCLWPMLEYWAVEEHLVIRTAPWLFQAWVCGQQELVNECIDRYVDHASPDATFVCRLSSEHHEERSGFMKTEELVMAVGTRVTDEWVRSWLSVARCRFTKYSTDYELVVCQAAIAWGRYTLVKNILKDRIKEAAVLAPIQNKSFQETPNIHTDVAADMGAKLLLWLKSATSFAQASSHNQDERRAFINWLETNQRVVYYVSLLESALEM